MREIKFMAWTGKEYDYDICINNSGKVINFDCGEYVGELDYVVEQYAGLKDWYEGDIIVDKYGNQAVIVFENSSFRAEPINGCNVRGTITGFDRKIGNIHLTPPTP